MNFFYLEPLEQFEIIPLCLLNTIFAFNFQTVMWAVFFNEITSLIIPQTFSLLLTSWSELDVLNILNKYIDYFDEYKDYFDETISINIDSFIYILLKLNINNIFIYFIILISIPLFIWVFIIKNILFIPNNWQLFFENIYTFVIDMLKAQVGKEAQKYFPYIFTIFLFILISNILGMTLFSFTLTSHIMTTFTLGVSSFIGLTILGFFIQKLAFFNLIIPKGIPTILLPFLMIIELISYLSRALSLSIRLFANLMSGHTLLHILAFFASKLFKFNLIIGLLAFLLILLIVVLEFCIALLQAYVFSILLCIYLNDSFHAGH